MELLIGVALAVVLAVLFVVLVLLVLPVRVDLSGAHLVRAIDRVARAMGLLEACPSCGVPAEELGHQGERRWFYCPACGRNPWLAGAPDAEPDSTEVAAS